AAASPAAPDRERPARRSTRRSRTSSSSHHRTRKPLANALTRIFMQEDLNFLLTNRIPRGLATRLVGRIARIEDPLFSRAAIALWRFFGDVDLDDAARTDFASLRDCFIRELKPGARPVDPNPSIVASPCDAQVGACGPIDGETLIQAKGFPYSLRDLLVDPEL